MFDHCKNLSGNLNESDHLDPTLCGGAFTPLQIQRRVYEPEANLPSIVSALSEVRNTLTRIEDKLDSLQHQVEQLQFGSKKENHISAPTLTEPTDL